jgi:hypothetical protein
MRVCGSHGGQSGNAKAKAAEVILEEKARGMLPASFAPHPDPIGELLATFSEVVAFRDAIRTLVNGLEERLRYESAVGTEQLRSEVAVYERALDRVVSTGEKLARLDLDARLARMQEVHLGPFIVEVLRAVLNDIRAALAAVTEVGQVLAVFDTTVASAVPKHVRAIEGGEAA